MNISKNGLDIIKKYEGLHLEAYLCPSGVWTIGYGHTSGVKKGMKITLEQAEEYLMKDCTAAVKAVNALGRNLAQNQFDALVSFTFNCGAGNLKTLCHNRTLAVIAEKILLYNKSGGKVLSGIVKRRKEEQALFLKSDETGGQISPTEAHSGIVEYSLLKDGNVQLSKNFTVREFRCKDGTDKILIDVDFVKDKLQAIREHFQAPVTINSAYRNAIYNKKVGGTSNSYHIKGQAFDIVVKGYTTNEVAKYAQTIGINGIIQYNRFVHVDSREDRYWSRNDNGNVTVVYTFYETTKPVLKIGSTGEDVKYVQSFLTEQGMYHGAIDGDFGPLTQQSVIEWQGYCEIIKDGTVGPCTWSTIG